MTNATPPPNSHRRLLAEIFADAEDHGLGTWGPTFQAHPDKIENAATFIETRAALLAEARLTGRTPDAQTWTDDRAANTAEGIISGDGEYSPLYAATLAALQYSLEHPGHNPTTHEIGRDAWRQLTPDQRAAALPQLLECFASRILNEQVELAKLRIDLNPEETTCLEPDDGPSLWEALHDGTTAETTVDRQALGRLFAEVELLRHRLNAANADQN